MSAWLPPNTVLHSTLQFALFVCTWPAFQWIWLWTRPLERAVRSENVLSSLFAEPRQEQDCAENQCRRGREKNGRASVKIRSLETTFNYEDAGGKKTWGFLSFWLRRRVCVTWLRAHSKRRVFALLALPPSSYRDGRMTSRLFVPSQLTSLLALFILFVHFRLECFSFKMLQFL